MKDGSYLRGHRIFRDLKPAELDELTGMFSLFHCRAGAYLIPAGSPIEGLYLIESGTVKGRDCAGEERIYREGDFLGAEALFSPCAAPGPVVTLDVTRVLYLDRREFLLWKDRRPRAVKRLALPGLSAGRKATSVLRENRLLWLVKTVPSLLFPPLFLARFLLRRAKRDLHRGRPA